MSKVMSEACRQEIIELHHFFQQWFNGEIENSNKEFARLERVLSNGFVLISPDGRRHERETLVADLVRAHGSRMGAFRILIDRVTCRPVSADITLVTYEEWQEMGERKTIRLSSALFRRKAGKPNNVEWLYVHETWLSSQEPDTG